MPLIVEDGTSKPDALSYVSATDADAYHLARGNLTWADALVAADTKEAALIRATSYLDATYRGRYPGYRTLGRAQSLEWPRAGAYTYVPDNGRADAFYYAGNRDSYFLNGYDYILPNVVPREIIAATCEAALRELTEPGSLAPDLERGGAVRRLQAGSVQIEYAANATATTTFQAIDKALVSLLMPASPYSGRAARG